MEHKKLTKAYERALKINRNLKGGNIDQRLWKKEEEKGKVYMKYYELHT